MEKLIMGVILLIIAGYLAIILLGSAFGIFSDTNTTGWNSSLASIWIIVPIIIAVGVVLLLIRSAIAEKS